MLNHIEAIERRECIECKLNRTSNDIIEEKTQTHPYDRKKKLLLECYKQNPQNPLKCTKEFSDFIEYVNASHEIFVLRNWSKFLIKLKARSKLLICRGYALFQFTWVTSAQTASYITIFDATRPGCWQPLMLQHTRHYTTFSHVFVIRVDASISLIKLASCKTALFPPQAPIFIYSHTPWLVFALQAMYVASEPP